MDTDDLSAVLAEYPELRRLIDLRDAGWRFVPIVDCGEVVELRGVRTWPGGWADALLVRYVTDARGVRVDRSGGITWQREGTLTDVVDDLITLHTPRDRAAPCLVVGRVPTVWTS